MERAVLPAALIRRAKIGSVIAKYRRRAVRQHNKGLAEITQGNFTLRGRRGSVGKAERVRLSL